MTERASKSASYPPTRRLHIAVGQAVRQRRKTLGMTQATLADLAHCDRQSISRLESAAYSPALVRIGEVCLALNILPSALFAVAEQIMSNPTPERSAP